MTSPTLEVAERAARRGGAILRRWFGQAILSEEKSLNDFASQADHESEAAILEEIRAAFPADAVLGEEGGWHAGSGGEEGPSAKPREWIVDPLDGTANFLHGVPYYCVSIACRDAEGLAVGVVYDPTHDDLFSAVRGEGMRRNGVPQRLERVAGLDGAMLATGFPFKAHRALGIYLAVFQDVFLRAGAVRRCGAAALDLAYTAAGVYDGFFEFRLAPWDLAAGTLLVREAGGRATDLDGADDFLRSGNVLAGPQGVWAELRGVVSIHTSEALVDRQSPRDGFAIDR